MQFSRRLEAFVVGRPDGAPFILGDWLSSLSEPDLDALLDLVGRTVYEGEGSAEESEVLDVLHLTVVAHKHETPSHAPLDPESIERMALGLELAVWREGTRRIEAAGVNRALSLMDASNAPFYAAPDDVSPAVARAWSSIQGGAVEEAAMSPR